MQVGESSPEREQFDRLPFEVYAADRRWSPASVAVSRSALRDASQGLTEMLPVLAVRDGRAVARAAAVREPDDERGGPPCGWVGLVECHPDEAAAGVAAIERCTHWLRDRGVAEPVGPGTSALVSGLLVDGFDRPQTFLTPYNPRWYAELWAGAGFRRVSEMLAVECTRDRVPRFPGRPPHGIRVRSAHVDRLARELAEIGAFQSAVFQGRPGHRSRSQRQLERLVDDLRPGLDPDLVLLAEDTEGRTIGVLIALADAWQRDPPAGGPDRARLLSIGVSDGWRGRHVALEMGRVLTSLLLDKGYSTLEGSWIRHDNLPAQSLARVLGFRVSRRFALLASR